MIPIFKPRKYKVEKCEVQLFFNIMHQGAEYLAKEDGTQMVRDFEIIARNFDFEEPKFHFDAGSYICYEMFHDDDEKRAEEFAHFTDKENGWSDAYDYVKTLVENMGTKPTRHVLVGKTKNCIVQDESYDCIEMSTKVFLNCCFSPMAWGLYRWDRENKEDKQDVLAELLMHAGPNLKRIGDMKGLMIAESGVFKIIRNDTYMSFTDISIGSIPYVAKLIEDADDDDEEEEEKDDKEEEEKDDDEQKDDDEEKDDDAEKDDDEEKDEEDDDEEEDDKEKDGKKVKDGKKKRCHEIADEFVIQSRFQDTGGKPLKSKSYADFNFCQDDIVLFYKRLMVSA